MTSITNTSIADKVTRSKTLPHNLQQCFEKALEYEASFQLSEGVNMAQKMTVMNVNVEEEDEFMYTQRFLFNRTKFFSCETSFSQNPSWLLPGLRKMLLYIILTPSGVMENVYP